MGRIKQGILGGFSGKVGTVVGGSWKGVSYMRSVAKSVRNPRTPKQVSHRSKFTLVMLFVKQLVPVLRVGFKLYANGQSATNAATSYLFANAVTGVYPAYTLDYAKVLISRGSLTPAQGGTVTLDGSTVRVNWDNNSGVGPAKATDRSLVLALNTVTHETVYTLEGTSRAAGEEELSTPAHWRGAQVAVFLGFVSEDGRDIANSAFLGKVTIV